MAGKRRKRLPGSYITQREAGTLSAVSGNAQAVYWSLRLCMNARTGRTHPIGYPLIERATGFGRDKVKRALSELKIAGLVVSERDDSSGFRRCIYSFPEALDCYGDRCIYAPTVRES